MRIVLKRQMQAERVGPDIQEARQHEQIDVGQGQPGVLRRADLPHRQVSELATQPFDVTPGRNELDLHAVGEPLAVVELRANFVEAFGRARVPCRSQSPQNVPARIWYASLRSASVKSNRSPISSGAWPRSSHSAT